MYAPQSRQLLSTTLERRCNIAAVMECPSAAARMIARAIFTLAGCLVRSILHRHSMLLVSVEEVLGA